ncbi:MAG: glycosyltransferase [Armatimonadetes bacterium]|nr:glycosyltransferase [Armatimonadota bacterium]
MNSYQPGVTAAIMVKNDAKRIERCIRSLQNSVDHIVVLDTGSSDGTDEIAEMMKVEVHRIEWPGAFDKALNILLEKVHTEWTFRVDSDEWLMPDMRPRFAEIMALNDCFLAGVHRRNLTGPKAYSDDVSYRLWRTDPEMRYVGFVHEYFSEPVMKRKRKEWKIALSGVRLMHDGYLNIDWAEKHRRNLELVRRELAERPGQLNYEVCEIDGMMFLQEPGWEPRLIEVVDRILTIEGRPEPMNITVALKYFLDKVADADASVRTQRVCDFIRSKLGDCPSVVRALADYDGRQGNISEQIRGYQALVEMGRTQKYSSAVAVNPYEITVYPLRKLIEIAEQTGDSNLEQSASQELQKYRV